MNSYNKITKAMQWLVATAALGLTCLAQAVEVYQVTLDTSSLAPVPGFYIDFQFNDGGTTPGNNTVTISDIMFGGGSVEAFIDIQGGASGDLSSGVQIMDTDFFNAFLQEFVPGSSLSFVVTLTNNANNPGDAPDAFAFNVWDSEWNAVAGLTANIDGSALTFETYAGVDGYQGVPAPGVTPVPEPSTYGLFAGLALAGLAFWRRRHRA